MTLPVKPKNNVAPAQYATATLNRVRAVLDEALELATSGKRRDAQGRDLHQALADAVLADPLAALERVHKLLAPAASAGQPAGGALVGSVGQLYLTALQAAQPQPGDEAKVVEAVGTSGVQGDASHSNDW